MDEISFGTAGWRATLETFTDERVRMVGQAAATYIRETEGTDKPVAVGYDARETSEGFAESLATVLTENGFDVLLADRDCPTPTISYAVVDRGLGGALVVTASHNPPEYNGVKFTPADGATASDEVTDALADALATPTSLPSGEHGTIERFDPVPAHARHARELVSTYVDVDLSGMRIVYDALHGSGRGVTDALLESAGATVIRRRCRLDPTFGGGAPEPSPETLEGLAAAVDDHDADLGIANDGDADRVALCTPDRGYLDGNLLYAALYDALLTDGGAYGPAVRTVSTTFLVDRIAAEHDETVHEVPVGFKWIAEAMADHDALIGGEESDGFTLRGHVREKDGVLVALLAAAVSTVDPLDERLDRIEARHGRIYADKVSVDCPNDRKTEVVAALEEAIPQTVAGRSIDRVVTLDGFKLLLTDGSWLLVRPSGTEPKLRVYAEASDPDRLEAVLEAGRELVESVLE
ncbi:MAG: phosphoglucomutase/phosphomannomutase family protein [Halobacteriota archaeon]